MMIEFNSSHVLLKMLAVQTRTVCAFVPSLKRLNSILMR
jgi:hypothetical protein